MKKYLLTVMTALIIQGCTKEVKVPSFTLDSFSFLTHNTVLVTYQNLNEMNEYPSGIKITGKVAFSKDTINYFNALFSPEKGKYSAMLFDLLPDIRYSISFYYADRHVSSETYNFRTNSVEYMADERDGKIYPIGKLGDQWWMLENLNYQTAGAISIEDSLLMGKYYTWTTAKSVCPPGWHLPSDEEWIELERFIGIPEIDLYKISQTRGRNEVAKLLTPGSYTMYSGLPDNLVVNELGFSLKACGYLPTNKQNESPNGLGMDGYYWSSTEYSLTDAFHHGSLYKSFQGVVDTVMAARLYMFKENKMCVRCLKD